MTRGPFRGPPLAGEHLLARIQGLLAKRPVQPLGALSSCARAGNRRLPDATARPLAQRRRGRRWSAVRLPAPPGGWDAAEQWRYPPTAQDARGPEVLALRSFAGGTAILAVTTRPGALVAYRSRNAGAAWSLASVLDTGSLSRPSGFSASGPSTWELPAPAGLFVTGDGGRKWDLEASGLSLPNFGAVSFAS